jgi:methylenetetrahydrofolate dehydrogenase (NADP+)/methenyltetrahydrofolate cyclohydrolase
MADIIDGKVISEAIKSELKGEIETLARKGVVPGLATVLVGDDPASASYVRSKGKACEKLGLYSRSIHLSETSQQQELLDVIDELAQDVKIHGILVQLPLPKHINEKVIINAIPPEKDVDGFHPMNKGKLLTGEDTFIPCTPAGVIEMLMRSGNDPEGKHVVILGRSQIVGMPLAVMLMQKKAGANATVTLCHTRTKNMLDYTKEADILIAAMGQPLSIKAEMIKAGVVIIDVGTSRVDDTTKKKGYRIAGDVDFDSVIDKVKAISPVPGGVGPMTITMLLKNTVKAAKRSD